MTIPTPVGEKMTIPTPVGEPHQNDDKDDGEGNDDSGVKPGGVDGVGDGDDVQRH